jgi:hypothetical protein
MKKEITLRVIIIPRNGKFIGICLETYHVVQADTIGDIEKKMEDQLIMYFDSFQPNEIESGQYKRLAPLSYRFLWRFVSLARSIDLVRSIILKSHAKYDIENHRLKFA